MEDSIFINKGPVSGCLTAYPSKSYIQRALLLGLLNEQGFEIKKFKESADSRAMLNSVIGLGAKVEISGDVINIIGLKNFVNCEIHCNESGLCMRLFAPVLAISDKEFRIKGKRSLLSRGNDYIPEALSQLGVKSSLMDDYLSVHGPLKSGTIHFDDPIGSQLISGLMFALSQINGDSRIIIRNPVSSPYIKMTAELLNKFGALIEIISENEICTKGNCKFIQGSVEIEGDWSGASFFLVAGAIAGNVKVTGLIDESLQADREIISYLQLSGAEVVIKGDSVQVKKANLKGFSADIKDHPDLFIPLVVLALNCEGTSKIFNYERLKHKESDRPSAIISELRKAGAKISVRDKFLEIEKSELSYCELNSYNDHRLAMGFAVAAINSRSGLKIIDHKCVNKSYPSFFEVLKVIHTEN